MRHNVEILGISYREFDQKGRIIAGVSMGKNNSYFGKSELNYNTALIYSNYDDDDRNEKSKLSIKKKQIYPVYDQIISARLNHYLLINIFIM